MSDKKDIHIIYHQILEGIKWYANNNKGKSTIELVLDELQQDIKCGTYDNITLLPELKFWEL